MRCWDLLPVVTRTGSRKSGAAADTLRNFLIRTALLALSRGRHLNLNLEVGASLDPRILGDERICSLNLTGEVAIPLWWSDRDLQTSGGL